MKRLAAVVIFAEGVTKLEAGRALRDLELRDIIDGKERQGAPLLHDARAGTKVHEYESDHGSPVFYIP